MPNYKYKARDSMGKVVKGKMEASGREEINDKLRKMGYMVTRVTEEAAAKGFNIEAFFEKLKPIRAEEMIMFYVQLSNMISAGIPLLTALDTFYQQVQTKKLKDALGGVARSVEGGDAFSKALAGYPNVFPKLFVNMVKAGEASGKLDMVSSRFAKYFENQEDLKQKVRGALFYPMILLIAGVAVTLFIVTFVMPQFAQIFMKSGITLPLPTLILYKTGTIIKNFWFSIILIFLVFGAGVNYYVNTQKGRLRFDTFKLKIPVLGTLVRKAAVSSFTRTLGTLTASGVSILESLDISREVIGNEVLSRIIDNARQAVEKGERLSEPLKISGEFPADCVQMVKAGEETGNLDDMLDKTADFYDMSLGYSIKKLTAVIEPVFLLIMGTLVGFIMASTLLPIFDMVKVIGH